jgi:hypothetical protein
MKLHMLALISVFTPGLAAAQGDPMQMAHLMNANQLGLLEYCQTKGWADEAAVEAQKSAGSSLPAAAGTSGLADAEATGRKGNLLNNGNSVPLASMAAQSNTTEQALCAKFVDSAKMAEAQRRSMPAMPTMPGGMAMPAMPNGMTMPGMPGMPKPQ